VNTLRARVTAHDIHPNEFFLLPIPNVLSLRVLSGLGFEILEEMGEGFQIVTFYIF
jgi:hypothetical protein